jgi:hypothetical protein
VYETAGGAISSHEQYRSENDRSITVCCSRGVGRKRKKFFAVGPPQQISPAFCMLPQQKHDLDFETIVTILISVVQRDFDVKTLLPTRKKKDSPSR